MTTAQGAMMAKAALELHGRAAQPHVRLPLVPADDASSSTCATCSQRPDSCHDLEGRHCMSHPHPDLAAPGPLPPRGPPGDPARRPGRGRPQHGRPRVRRPAAHHRLRRAVPRRPPAGRRPDPARLRPDPGPARRHRGGRAHARPRGPHRRGAVPAARAPRHPARRLEADPRPARGRSCASTGSETVQHEVKEGDTIQFGPFELEFVAVNHSIPDALAVAVRTGAGMVLHTGDFKMDQLPLDGRITDLRAFARLGEEGVDLFLVDSTNAEVPGLHHRRARHRPGARPGLPQGARPADHRRLLRLPRAPRPAGDGRRRGARPQGRVRRPLDGAQHGGRPRPRLPRRAARHAGRRQGARRLPAREDRAHLDRVAGRAAVGAVADRAPQPRPRPHRAGRHRRARLQPDPRQRERRLPGDQRADPAGAPTSCTRATRWCTSRVTRRRASCSTATTSCSPAT